MIGLGANLGNREETLTIAWKRLSDVPGVHPERLSRFVETDPLGGPPNQPKYLNAVGLVRTDLTAEQLLDVVLQIEHDLGRRRTIPWGPRTIDMDILLFGNACVSTRQLTIPHPRMCFRRFVLEPAAEIVPQMVHPHQGKTIRQLLSEITIP